MKRFFQMKSIALFVVGIILLSSACGTISKGTSTSMPSSTTNNAVVPEKNTSSSYHNTASGLPDYTQPPETLLRKDGSGWAFYPGQNADHPELFETKDGGLNWNKAKVTLPQGMDGLSYFVTSLLETRDGVVFVLQMKHNPPLAHDIYYEFVLDETTGTWHWSIPDGASELGKSALAFYDYIVSQAQYFPPDFIPESSLQDRVTIQKLVYDAAARKKENENLQPPIFVSYEEVNHLAAALYAITDFDAAVLEDGNFTWFQPVEGGWMVSLEEYIGDGWETLLEDVEINPDGTISATTLTVFGLSNSEATVRPILRKSTLQPSIYEGEPVFTLQKNEQHDFTEADWPIPHWLWDDEQK